MGVTLYILSNTTNTSICEYSIGLVVFIKKFGYQILGIKVMHRVKSESNPFKLCSMRINLKTVK